MSKAGSRPHKRLDIPPEFSGAVQEHYDRYIADASLSDPEVLLLSVYIVEFSHQTAGAEYAETKETFVALSRREDNFRKAIHVTRQKYLDLEGTRLYFRAEGLELLRKKLGQIGKSPVYVVKSGQQFSGIKLFENFLTNEMKNKELLICDPYVSHITLFPLSILTGTLTNVRLLTANVFEEEKFRHYSERLSKESGITLETRLNRKIHDRYLISGESCWALGTSIKDIGNKDTTIRDISEVIASMTSLFQERWNESTTF